VGQINAINIFSYELNADNVIGVTEADPKEEQKQTMKKAMEDYR
jgi:hypothetical protein